MPVDALRNPSILAVQFGMIAVILNPRSGSVSDAEKLVADIIAALPGARILMPQAPGEAASLAAQAAVEGCKTILAAGGDGTLNEVLNGVMPHAAEVQLGLLPLGTGNDFARTLKLPADLSQTLEIIKAGNLRQFDVVRVSGRDRPRYFLNIAAGGFSGAVSEKLTPELKSTWGPLSYFRGMVEALPELKPFACELTLDDHQSLSLSILNLVIANAPFVAKGIPIAPEADPSDGWLDVIAIRETSGPRLALLTPQALTGNHLLNEDVFFVRAKRVAVNATPRMPFNTDGELIGDSPWVFDVCHLAVTMIVPEE